MNKPVLKLLTVTITLNETIALNDRAWHVLQDALTDADLGGAIAGTVYDELTDRIPIEIREALSVDVRE